VPPPQKKKIEKKYFSGNYHKKIRTFSDKYRKNSCILIIFRANNHVNVGHFVNFSYITFGEEQDVLPPKLTELLRLYGVAVGDPFPVP